MIRLVQPGTGAIIAVVEEKAEFWKARGYKPVPVKEQVKKPTARKKKSD